METPILGVKLYFASLYSKNEQINPYVLNQRVNYSFLLKFDMADEITIQ